LPWQRTRSLSDQNNVEKLFLDRKVDLRVHFDVGAVKEVFPGQPKHAVKGSWAGHLFAQPHQGVFEVYRKPPLQLILQVNAGLDGRV
jgi:hypothetical protein